MWLWEDLEAMPDWVTLVAELVISSSESEHVGMDPYVKLQQVSGKDFLVYQLVFLVSGASIHLRGQSVSRAHPIEGR